jgi:hypothetical protein
MQPAKDSIPVFDHPFGIVPARSIRKAPNEARTQKEEHDLKGNRNRQTTCPDAKTMPKSTQYASAVPIVAEVIIALTPRPRLLLSTAISATSTGTIEVSRPLPIPCLESVRIEEQKRKEHAHNDDSGCNHLTRRETRS